MAAKAILILCAQALIAQNAYTQCLGRGGFDPRIGSPIGFGNRGWGYDNLAADSWPSRGLGCIAPAMDFTPTSGGSFTVTSTSTVPPTGLSIISENMYDGPLAVAGEVPFVGTAFVEGSVPTAGAGAINYGCGNGITVMVSENVGPAYSAAAVPSPAYGSAFGSFGAPAMTPGLGFGGCGRF